MARAKAVAEAIPPMKAALATAEQPDVMTLVDAMQDDAVRQRVFALMADPSLSDRVAARRQQLEDETLRAALDPSRVASLRRLLAEDRLDDVSTDALSLMTERVQWLAMHRDIAAAARASKAPGASLVADASQAIQLSRAMERAGTLLAERCAEGRRASSPPRRSLEAGR